MLLRPRTAPAVQCGLPFWLTGHFFASTAKASPRTPNDIVTLNPSKGYVLSRLVPYDLRTYFANHISLEPSVYCLAVHYPVFFFYFSGNMFFFCYWIFCPCAPVRWRQSFFFFLANIPISFYRHLDWCIAWSGRNLAFGLQTQRKAPVSLRPGLARSSQFCTIFADALTNLIWDFMVGEAGQKQGGSMWD